MLICLSCKNENMEKTKSPGLVEVKLKSTMDGEFKFDELVFTDFPVNTNEYTHPLFHKKNLERFSISSGLDSFKIVTRFMDYHPFYYQLYKLGQESKSDYLKVSEEMGRKAINYPDDLRNQFNAVSGFSNDQQIVIADLNNNRDFLDDTILKFDKNFRKEHHGSEAILDTLPILDFHYKLYGAGKLLNIKRKIQLYPYMDHPYITFAQELGEKANNYTIFFRLKDYFRGHLKLKNVDYTIAVQGLNNYSASIIIKPDSIHGDKNDIYFQENFKYDIGDTIGRGNQSLRLDSLSDDLSTVFFTKITQKDKIFGYRLGQSLPNERLTDLDGHVKQLTETVDPQKKLTVLDFWGTWCLPCIKLIPDIKRMHLKYADKVNFISIAFDEDSKRVKKFVDSSQISWSQAFVSYDDRKGSIVDNLNIHAFPTIIVLDGNNKIIYRNSPSSLDEILGLIESKL
jgi:thiol-disulfide isomerase/thioredoxin